MTKISSVIFATETVIPAKSSSERHEEALENIAHTTALILPLALHYLQIEDGALGSFDYTKDQTSSHLSADALFALNLLWRQASDDCVIQGYTHFSNGVALATVQVDNLVSSMGLAATITGVTKLALHAYFEQIAQMTGRPVTCLALESETIGKYHLLNEKFAGSIQVLLVSKATQSKAGTLQAEACFVLAHRGAPVAYHSVLYSIENASLAPSGLLS